MLLVFSLTSSWTACSSALAWSSACFWGFSRYSFNFALYVFEALPNLTISFSLVVISSFSSALSTVSSTSLISLIRPSTNLGLVANVWASALSSKPLTILRVLIAPSMALTFLSACLYLSVKSAWDWPSKSLTCWLNLRSESKLPITLPIADFTSPDIAVALSAQLPIWDFIHVNSSSWSSDNCWPVLISSSSFIFR